MGGSCGREAAQPARPAHETEPRLLPGRGRGQARLRRAGKWIMPERPMASGWQAAPDALVDPEAPARHRVLSAGMTGLLDLGPWVPILDGDPFAAAMYERHYSALRTLRRRTETGAMLFVGPGQKLILMTPCRRALFAWRVCKFRADDLEGVECSIFRNEGAGLSSDLVRAADQLADARWPGRPHFTFVDAPLTARGRSAASKPGACFIHAGWELLGEVSKKRGLNILVRPAASLPRSAATRPRA